MDEIWKDIVGYEGLYKVSNLGRIRSINRKIKIYRKDDTVCDLKLKGKILSCFPNKQGYLKVRICNKNYFVHRLVAAAFIPNPDNKKTINHINGIKNDNCVSNLEWSTQSENNKHAYNIGLKTYSYGMYIARYKGQKISHLQVEEIINKRKNNIPVSNIAIEYNISKSQVYRIVNNKSRKYNFIFKQQVL